VLRTQHRRRDQHGDLLAVHRRAERRADRHLRLAEADVSAHEPVHWLRALHVRQHVLDRGVLIRRLLEREGGLELLELAIARREAEALGQLARRVQVQQLARHVAQGPLHLLTRLLPALPAELVEPRRVTLGTDVALHQVQAIHRHEETVAAFVFETQELALELRAGAAQIERDEPAVDADPVFGVHERVAGLQLREPLDRRGFADRSVVAPALAGAEQLLLGEQREAVGRQREALGQVGDAHLDATGAAPARARPRIPRELRREPVLRE